MGVHRGPKDDCTMEMYRWWFIEEDNLDKMLRVIIPRFKDYPIDEPYTALYRLPTVRMKSVETRNNVFWKQCKEID